MATPAQPTQEWKTTAKPVCATPASVEATPFLTQEAIYEAAHGGQRPPKVAEGVPFSSLPHIGL